MSDRRKNAYRYLLYCAMIEIRSLAWQPSARTFIFQSDEQKQYAEDAHYAGVLADWLHNLAMYSAFDFVKFDEVQFWSQYRSLNKRFPPFRDHLKQYRRVFKERR